MERYRHVLFKLSPNDERLIGELTLAGVIDHKIATGEYTDLGIKPENYDLEARLNRYDEIIEISWEDSLASDGMEMIEAALRDKKGLE